MAKTTPPNVKKVLIYRLGSIGDTVVALPAIRLVARAFPEAERRVLTNVPIGAKDAPLESVLVGTGLSHGYMRYPLGVRSIGKLQQLRSEILEWGPDLLVYLAAARGRIKAVRDLLFFRLCGIRKMIGVPREAAEKEHMPLPQAVWQFYRYFIVTSVVEPKDLKKK